MPLLLLFVVFVVVPIAELWAIIQVGQAIGVLPTIGLLLLDSLIGTLLMRSQGRLAWQRFNATLAAGRPPAREVFDGGLVILGGAFLLTPGFLTDALGLALLLPPSRAVARRLLVRGFARRFALRVATPGVGPFSAGAPSDFDVDGTARDVSPEPPRRLP